MTNSSDIELKRRLRVAIGFTAVVFFAELGGGYLTNSLALLSDSAHVFMDALALFLTLSALYICELPSTENRTYGLHRVEVFAAFLNGLTVFAVAVFILYRAYLRFLDPPAVESTGMLIVAVFGLLVNLAVARGLHGFAKSDLNVRSAFLHVVGDAAASVGVIAGAIIIHFTGAYIADPIVSAGIGCVILWGSLRIILEASHILLEGVPRSVDLNDVVKDIMSFEGVSGLHSLHIWSICHNVNALSAHVDVSARYAAPSGELLKKINERLAERYSIFYTTLQVECPGCEGRSEGEVLRTMAHRDNRRTPGN
ncbi:MAG TPA: cation diffusion facilitator family transporter [Thermodesulfobacteriota bacterium]|nr:cation diffusion facilitator family transporter [Thermodesulfobacteriota bacterium]